MVLIAEKCEQANGGDVSIKVQPPNYAFKRTAELALGSNQVFAPQPLNAALGVFAGLVAGGDLESMEYPKLA